MAITAERLMVEVDADTSKAERGLDGFSDKGMRSFGWVGAAGAAVAGMATAAGVGIAYTVDKAGDLEQSMGAVDSVFKASADTVDAWAQGAAQAVGLTTDAYNSSASVIGAMLTNYGVAADRVAESTNSVVGYGADLAAMFGGTTQEAVDALGAALRGEADPAERFGLSLNKTAVNAHMAATGITNQAEATLDLIAKQMEASGAMGQFSREAETLQGATQRNAAAWTNITASIGNLFLPAAAAAQVALGEFLPRIQSVVDGLGGIQSIFRDGDFLGAGATFGWAEDSAPIDFLFDLREAFIGAGGGFDGLQAAAQAAFTALTTWLTSGGIQMILDAIMSGREALFGAAMRVFPALLEGAVSVLPGLVTWVTGVMLPQIIGLIVTSAPMLLTAAVTLFTGLLGGVAQVVPTLLAAVVTLVPQLLGSLVGMAPMLLGAAVTLFTGLVQAVVTIIPTLVGTVVGLLPVLITSLLGMLPGILGAAVSMFLGLVEAVATVLPTLLASILGMLPGLIGSILNMLPGILTAGVTLFMALVDAVLTILPDLLTTLIGDVLPALLTTILGMLPQLLTTAVTLFVALVTAITTALPRIVTALIGILPVLIGVLLGMVPQILAAAVTVFLALVPAIARAVPQILGALATMGVSMVREVGNIDLAAAGRTILDGFLRGLKAGFESVKSFVGGIGDWIAANKGPKTYDLALLQPAGGWIMQGFGRSLSSAFDQHVAPVVDGVSASIRAGIAGPGRVTGGGRLTPAAVGATGGTGGPTTLVIVDANRELIGRMRVESGKVATGQVTPLDEGLPRW